MDFGSTPKPLNLCPNCNYNNDVPTGDLITITLGDGTPTQKAAACARCGYAKPAGIHATELTASLKGPETDASLKTNHGMPPPEAELADVELVEVEKTDVEQAETEVPEQTPEKETVEVPAEEKAPIEQEVPVAQEATSEPGLGTITQSAEVGQLNSAAEAKPEVSEAAPEAKSEAAETTPKPVAEGTPAA